MAHGSTAPYEFGRATGRCAVTGGEFAPGTPFIAVVWERPDGALERADIAPDAWESGSRPDGPGRVFAAWRTSAPDPDRPRHALIDDEDLMELFARPAHEPDDAFEGVRYLMALALIRRKKLIYEGGRPADRAGERPGVMYVRPKGVAAPPEGPALLEVVDPGLTEDRALALSEQLGTIMNLDADADGGAP